MKQSISTITPVYNGSAYLEQLVQHLDELKSNIEKSYNNLELVECIFVVDECIDNSLEVLQRLSHTYDWVHIIEHSRNFGQHPATITGILHSSGDWVCTLDEDLQHKPKYILDMLKSLVSDSYDVCYAKSKSKIHSSFLRDQFSRFFKSSVALLINNKYVRDFSSFRCMRGSIARGAAASSSMETYFDISLSWFTQRITTCEVDLHDERNSTNQGKSGYSFFGLVRHSKRLIFSSNFKFLRLITILGILSFSFSLIYSSFVLYRFFFSEAIAIKGWPSTIISIYFFGGLTCLFLGIIMELLSEMLLKSKGKPAFFVVDRSKDYLIKEELDKG